MHSSVKRIDLGFFIKASIIVVLWSTPPLVSKLWVGTKGTFPGLFFGFLRYFSGFFALFLLILFTTNFKNLKTFLEHPFWFLFCSCWLVLMIFGQNFSVHYILGSSSSVLLNFNPVLIYLFAPLLFAGDEKYSFKKTLGFIISSFGIGVVFLASLEMNSITVVDFIIGNGLGFLSGVAWAGYSLSLKKFFQEGQSEEVTALNLLIAAIILLVLSLITETLPPIESYTLESIWGIVVIGIGAAAIAFTLYLQLVQKYGPSKAGNIQFMIPLVSLLFAWIFLNEFSVFALVGGILCAIGVALVNYERPLGNMNRTGKNDIG